MEDLLPFEKEKRQLLIKKEAETDWSYGQDPNKRSVNELINYGIINLNKPENPTSHMVSAYVQEILNINKTGHSGTLDPAVTGVLPIALGKATRIVQTLLKAGKEYICLMHLHKEISEKEILEGVKKFKGKIQQLPPVKSAVKRQIREREIYYFNILEIQDRDVLFKIGCEAGTYIRKIVHDFGLSLNTGANMQQLIRTKAGPFTDKTWISLHDLKDSYELYKKENNEKEIRKIILPIEKAIEHLPKIYVLDSTIDTLCHGADLNIPGISKLDSGIKENDVVAVLTLKDELICLGNALTTSKEIMEKPLGSAVKTRKVFMSTGIYPKFKR